MRCRQEAAPITLQKPFQTLNTSSNWFVIVSKNKSLQRIRALAREKERRYDWTGAVGFYQKALDRLMKQRDFGKAGGIEERIAYCLYRGAFQVETQEEFKSRILEAVEAYEKAAEVYEKVDHAKSLYCKAMALYANSWTVVAASQKKVVLDECSKMLKEAMTVFEEAGDPLDYGKACNDLSQCLLNRTNLEWGWTENKRHLEEAIEHGQNAISMLSRIGVETELARAYVIAGLHSLRAGGG